MPRDNDTAKFKATITVELVPLNKYGDELFESGTFTYSKVLQVTTITNLGMVLDRLSGVGVTIPDNEPGGPIPIISETNHLD